MNRNNQRGVSVIFAIFLMVVVSSMAAVMARLVAGSSLGAAQDVLGTQARQAALAGLDVGLYQWIAGTGTSWCDAQGSAGQIMSTSLATGYQVRLQCTRGSNDLGGTILDTARIVATACATGGSCPNTTNPNRLGYVERRVEATASR